MGKGQIHVKSKMAEFHYEMHEYIYIYSHYISIIGYFLGFKLHVNFDKDKCTLYYMHIVRFVGVLQLLPDYVIKYGQH